MFDVVIAVAAFIAGTVASVAGFGIGSILTPVLSTQVGTGSAVAAVAIPHFAGTLLRFLLLRGHLDKTVLLHFGILSAAGGLVGAMLHSIAANPVLTWIFGAVLIVSGIGTLTGLNRSVRFGNGIAWLAGAISGMLGGLVGNQGGIRSAALLGFGLEPRAFVATATATGLIVDAARLPVYFATSSSALRELNSTIILATLFVVLGTLSGARILRNVPKTAFQMIVGGLILILGVYMLVGANRLPPVMETGGEHRSAPPPVSNR